MGKVTIEMASSFVSEIVIDLREASDAQKEYFKKAYAAFLKNQHWREFGSEWFYPNQEIRNLVSPRTFESFVRHPLYLAVEELWFALRVNQGDRTIKEDRFVRILIQ